MAGGLLQLVAYGSQDIYLTGNPQITFWINVYKRHTNFAMEEIQQISNGSTIFGGEVTFTIGRNGDLMSNCFLEAEIEVPGDDDGSVSVNTPTDHFMERLIKYVEVEIGGQLIDTQYGLWMHIWNRLTLSDTKLKAYNYMIGSKPDKDTNSPFLEPDPISRTSKLNLPLQFWFCKNPGLALPLIALQYHEVKIKVQIAASGDVQTGSDEDGKYELKGLNLWVNYIYLDTVERRRFQQKSHEYLITQVQYTGVESLIPAPSPNETILNFNHPVIELMWVNYKGDDAADNWSSFWNYIDSATLKLNGHDRFAPRDGTYFDTLQPFTYHTNNKTGVNVYSFALYPEDASRQPSGTCNFSRIDNATLSQTLKSTFDASGNMHMYALNYNVLRIMSGMGGLAYSQ